jgi:hypothetical protein
MTGDKHIMRRSEIDKELYKVATDDPSTKERDIVDRKVEWYLIAGDKIIERSEWAGR